MPQLTTDWSQTLDQNHILQEYPRPQMKRDSYFNLNGTWKYTVDPISPSEKKDILVPFSPETQASGADFVLKPKQILHYEKRFTLPEGFIKDHVLLHFGAVDQECNVELNGIKIGSHSGGYLAFSFDITDALQDGENVLKVHVRDATEFAPHARGKQKLKKLKGGMSYLFYTPQSGIWKTVWLESVPDTYIKDLRITPIYNQGLVKINFNLHMGFQLIESDRDMEITILDSEEEGAEVLWHQKCSLAKSIYAELPDFIPWTPENPKLYYLKIRIEHDEVQSYFGMRKLSVEPDQNGILRFFLNNKPYFFHGVLDQGYWPESLMTPPSDEALLYDIRQLKEMGFNTIRKHIKIESDRFYYHCDKLGMFVWQDMPCGGDSYKMPFVTYLPTVSTWIQRHVPDHYYRLFARKDKKGRAQYYQDLRGMMSQLYSHPCIAAWVAFNEGWGQFDAKKATELIRKHGGNRFVNEACGWYDQGGGDMYTIHNYFRKLKIKPQKDRVVALTEYGGYAYEVKDHVACEKKVGYKSYKSQEELLKNYQKLFKDQILPNIKNGLSAAIYTQTSDIEEEINGLMTYDRQVTKFPVEELKEISAQILEEFEANI